MYPFNYAQPTPDHIGWLLGLFSLLMCMLTASPQVNATPQVPLLIDDFHRIFTPEERTLPEAIQRLLLAYPDQLSTAQHTRSGDIKLIWHQGPETLIKSPSPSRSLEEWQESTASQRRDWWGGRSFETVLNHADLGDQLLQHYPVAQPLPSKLPVNFEPGRVRDEQFFKRVYGERRTLVGQHIKRIKWGSQIIKVTRVNRIDERLRVIYRELKGLPRRSKRFFETSAGAFVWRKIKGTSRLSVHSFGAAIDLGVKHAHYWRWTLKVYGKTKEGEIPYHNRFPEEVVRIFERYGFIWGGWWYHHDTMHFEYRPELLVHLPSSINQPSSSP